MKVLVLVMLFAIASASEKNVAPSKTEGKDCVATVKTAGKDKDLKVSEVVCPAKTPAPAPTTTPAPDKKQ